MDNHSSNSSAKDSSRDQVEDRAEESSVETGSDLLTDVSYLCKATPLIVNSLQRGCDVAQLPNGDVLVTEVKVINNQFSWNKEKNKMVRTTH